MPSVQAIQNKSSAATNAKCCHACGDPEQREHSSQHRHRNSAQFVLFSGHSGRCKNRKYPENDWSQLSAWINSLLEINLSLGRLLEWSFAQERWSFQGWNLYITSGFYMWDHQIYFNVCLTLYNFIKLYNIQLYIIYNFKKVSLFSWLFQGFPPPEVAGVDLLLFSINK